MSDPISRFVKIGVDGNDLPADADAWEAVRDTATGLMWTKEDVQVSHHKDAAAAAEKMTAAGFNDWRLPTVEELFLLGDRARSAPAIDTDFFPDCHSDWYWSSTPYASSPGDCAWYVFFYDGGAYWNLRSNGGFVRAVRAGQ